MHFLDGGFGTLIQAAGLPIGKDPADWNIENPSAVSAIHAAYIDAGAEVVLTNTFGVNRIKYHGEYAISELVEAAIENARACSDKPHKVALDIGPTGKLLKPAGDLSFTDAFTAFAETVKAGSKADLIYIETFGDIREIKAAVLAAKTYSTLPIFVTVTLDNTGKLLTGGSIGAVSALLEGLDVSAYGFNCGLGPKLLLPFVKELKALTTKPVIVKPNAGMPKLVEGKTVFELSPKEFAIEVAELIKAGALIVGGCCGTNPEYIKALKAIANFPNTPNVLPCSSTVIASGVKAVEFHSGEGLIIGERINPTGKKRLREAYQNGDVAYIMREAVTQVDNGAQVLDINCGVPGIDEAATLVRTLDAVESVVNVPLVLDTSDPVALEAGLRAVNGKALINSVNGKREVMDFVFPLVKKYGGVVVGLCLDERGIPNTIEGRVEIAKRILAEGEKYGLSKKDFIFDALTLSVSAEANAAIITLGTVKRLTEELKVNTVLGVSNVSFGLPNRAELNNAMYTLAKRVGLSAAIANPSVIKEVENEAAFDVLLNRDSGCARWIALNAEVAPAPVIVNTELTLKTAIEKGLKDDAKTIAESLIASRDPLELINGEIIPALEVVGKGFETGKVYLPQLLMSADAAGEAFSVVKRSLLTHPAPSTKHQLPIILATVKGDIHDIGKNIVRSLLENYGFKVIDLGRDVAPEVVVETAKREKAGLVGLSALMTTTAPAMAETIKLLKAERLPCKVCVGGAVITESYAQQIGADYYAKDAMRTVRIAESLIGG